MWLVKIEMKRFSGVDNVVLVHCELFWFDVSVESFGGKILSGIDHFLGRCIEKSVCANS